MNSKDMYRLLKEVQADYVAMARDLNYRKRGLVKPYDPWTLPLVRAMQDALNQLALEAKIYSQPK